MTLALEVISLMFLIMIAYHVRTWWILILNGLSVVGLSISIMNDSDSFYLGLAYLAVGLPMVVHGAKIAFRGIQDE